MSLWIIALVASMFALVWLTGMWLGRVRVREHIHCEPKNIDVDTDFERALSPTWSAGMRLDVVRCSAFDEPDHVNCAKVCLRHPLPAGASGTCRTGGTLPVL